MVLDHGEVIGSLHQAGDISRHGEHAVGQAVEDPEQAVASVNVKYHAPRVVVIQFFHRNREVGV